MKQRGKAVTAGCILLALLAESDYEGWKQVQDAGGSESDFFKRNVQFSQTGGRKV